MESENRDDKGRWLPGHSEAGPGRPRFSIVSIIKEKLQSVPEGEKRPLIESLIDEYIADARERRDGVAIRDIIDRFDGKPKQSMDIHDEREDEWRRLVRDIFLEGGDGGSDDG